MQRFIGKTAPGIGRAAARRVPAEGATLAFADGPITSTGRYPPVVAFPGTWPHFHVRTPAPASEPGPASSPNPRIRISHST